MILKGLIQEIINEHLEIIKMLKHDSDFTNNIIEISKLIIDSFKLGGKLLICGNGGSAADSQHLATELVSRFFIERRALDAEALTVNTSTLTAIANDYSFDKVFARQVEAKGKEGDVLLAISTSGNSKNVIEAIKAAKSIGIKTIGFVGNNIDSLICRMSDYYVLIPSNSTPRIQETHILTGHIICEIVERNLFEKNINP